MDFEEIIISWFLSWGSDQRVSLHNRGLCHVEGSNEDDDTTDSVGSGKSSLFEAIVWALYGKTIKKRSHADAVVHRRRPRNAGTYVTLTVRVAAVVYVISRHRKSPKHRNKLFVHADGKDVSHLDPKETQALIDKLVGMDYHTFVNSIFFGQGLLARFAALEPNDKHQILERVLGLGEYGRAAKIANERATEARRDAATLSQELMWLESEVERSRAAFRAARADGKAWAKRHAAELERLSVRLAALVEDHKPPVELAATRRAVAQLRAQRQEQHDALVVAKGEVTTRSAALRQLQREVSERCAEPTLKFGARCHVCSTQITPATVKAHQAFVDRQTRILKTQIEKATDAHRTALARSNRLAKALPAATKRLQAMQARLDKLQQQAVAAAATERAMAEVRRTRAAKEKEHNPHPKIVKTALKALKRHRAKYAEVAARLDAAHEAVAAFSFWAVGFGPKGLKSLRLDAAIPMLNKYANKYISILSDGNIKIEISTTDVLRTGEKTQRLNVSATNRWGGSAYEDQSGGEGLKVDVALALGMQALAASRSQRKINIALFDEPTIYLDATGQEAFMKVLIEEAKTKASVFVCTHDDSLKGYFPATIAVRKKSGITTIAA